jgi:hypothetical protein
MSMRCAPSLCVLALLVSAGCASSPSTPRAPAGTGGADPASASGAGRSGTASDPQARASAPQSAAGAAAASGGAIAGSGAGAGAAADAAVPASGPGQTSEERRAAIDKRLNDSLGSFDAGLRQEQQQVAQQRDARQTAAAANAAANAAAAAAALEKSGEGAGSAAVEGPDTDRGGRRGGPAPRRHDPSGDLKSEKASKSDDNAGNGASAREIPDGSDDDVVARRLRQAAQQETDPELKEKLWQEYLDYKKNAQGK